MGEENNQRGMNQKRNVEVRCRQNLPTLRVGWELDFLRTVVICSANSLSGKGRPPGADRQTQRRRPQGLVQRESLSGSI